MQDRSADIQESGFTDHHLVGMNERNSNYGACAGVHASAVYEPDEPWSRVRGLFWSQVYIAAVVSLAAIEVALRGRWANSR